jgi:helix-turn-helix protein
MSDDSQFVPHEPADAILVVTWTELDLAFAGVDGGQFAERLDTFARDLNTRLGAEEHDHSPDLRRLLFAMAITPKPHLRPHDGVKVVCASPAQRTTPEGWDREAHISVVCHLAENGRLRFHVTAQRYDHSCCEFDVQSDERLLTLSSEFEVSDFEPSFRNIARVAQALQLSLDDLFGPEEPESARLVSGLPAGTFGWKMVCLRKAAGLTVAELSTSTGIDCEELMAYERGDRVPELAEIVEIAEGLQVSITAFLPDTLAE